MRSKSIVLLIGDRPGGYVCWAAILIGKIGGEIIYMDTFINCLTVEEKYE